MSRVIISGPETVFFFVAECFCVCSSRQLSPARPAYRRFSGASPRQDERRSRSGRHRSHDHRPISESASCNLCSPSYIVKSAAYCLPLLFFNPAPQCLFPPTSPSLLPLLPSLLRWGLTASEVCRVTSLLWRRWLSSRFSTPRCLTTSRSSLPGGTHTIKLWFLNVYDVSCKGNLTKNLTKNFKKGFCLSGTFTF